MTKADLYEMFISPLTDDNAMDLNQLSEVFDDWTHAVCTMHDEESVPKSEQIRVYKKAIFDINDPGYHGNPNKDTVSAFAYGLSLSLFKE